MAKKEKTTNAVDILHRRYIKGAPQREASLQAERVNAEVARLIHDLRKDADLSQKELAELVGSTQSVISRLEDADYEGHSLSMLHRVAEALKQKLTVVMTAQDPQIGVLGYAFVLCVRMLRRGRGLTVDQLAAGAEIDRDEIVAMERNNGYRPTPLTLHRLGQFYGIPQRRLMALAGAVEDDDVVEHASRFAAQSESFAELTKEEKKALDDFVRFLKTES
jgi:transcriptional regulator with XRE-family HTH domain